MKTIALICHPDDNRLAKVLVAELRSQLNLAEYAIWQKSENLTGFDGVATQLGSAIRSAWAVLVMVGEKGVDLEFERLSAEAVQQRILDDGQTFGRLLVKLSDSAVPKALLPWVSVDMEGAPAARATAQRVLERLRIRPRWADALNIDAAVGCIPAGPAHATMVRYLKEVAQMLADGKPLTLMIGPYASVENRDDGSCPSRVRSRLLEMIDDPGLRGMLGTLDAAVSVGAVPPLIWQDHLATLCILSGRSREDVAAVIEQAIGAADGDESGPPSGQFAAVGRLSAALGSADLPRVAGLPAVTLLTVCPGLRTERALVANGCPFERAALMLGNSARPELHRVAYVPAALHRRRALEGAGPVAYMPVEQAIQPSDEIHFVRLVKLFGSRDLDRGVPSGDLGQAYELLGQLRSLLENFVEAVGRGPYVVLGGGLVTPPMQAAHAMLLRSALNKPERRPRLAIVPPASASPDPLRQAEVGRLARLTAVPNSGFDRIQLVPGDPVAFIDALTVAFGGAIGDPARIEAA